MTIRIEAYDRLPDAARAIREQAFIRERDWRPEFDEWDAASVHLLAFDSVDSSDRPGPSAQNRPRLFSPASPASPTRIAPWRLAGSMRTPTIPTNPGDTSSRGLRCCPRRKASASARGLLADAERRIAQAGGTMAAVHSENDHYKFYEQRGYRLTDEVYEGGRHGWLVKDLSRNV